ncbi:MAG: peptidoglycan editing factor PgeF [Oscillospiraceae bacterium]|jgi:YfiH family protein
MAFVQQEQNGLVFMTVEGFGVRHAFSTRLGGVSTGYLSSLNLGENRGDDPAHVKENYRRLGAAVGIDTTEMVYTKQVHGNVVRVASRSDCRHPYDPFLYEADGLVTNEKDLPLIAFTADCIPMLLSDPIDGVVAAVHCGWRSTVSDIAGNAIDAMCTLGAKLENICAAIGPGISFCCFETGPEIPEAITAFLGETDAAPLFCPESDVPGKFMVDLKGTNRTRLLQKGILAENITVSEECTVCSSQKYWSHRATHGMRGAQACIVAL